jgi:hypothetical protein
MLVQLSIRELDHMGMEYRVWQAGKLYTVSDIGRVSQQRQMAFPWTMLMPIRFSVAK